MARAALRAALLLAAGLLEAGAVIKELYTTNAVCKQRRCVNPIFPAMDQLPMLSKHKWVKYKKENVSRLADFCGSFLTYDPALIVQPSVKDQLLNASQRESEGLPVTEFDFPIYSDQLKGSTALQDRLAQKMYFYHLSGLGIEPWDHTNPTEESLHPLRQCALSVAKMVCYTYFPQGLVGLVEGMKSSYLRPCRSCCENYLQACNIECCDESVTCVWDGTNPGETPETNSRKTASANGKTVLLELGYVDEAGPSMLCTGGASPTAHHGVVGLIAAFILSVLAN